MRSEPSGSVIQQVCGGPMWHGAHRPRPAATQEGQMESAFALVTFIWRDK